MITWFGCTPGLAGERGGKRRAHSSNLSPLLAGAPIPPRRSRNIQLSSSADRPFRCASRGRQRPVAASGLHLALSGAGEERAVRGKRASCQLQLPPPPPPPLSPPAATLVDLSCVPAPQVTQQCSTEVAAAAAAMSEVALKVAMACEVRCGWGGGAGSAAEHLEPGAYTSARLCGGRQSPCVPRAPTAAGLRGRSAASGGEAAGCGGGRHRPGGAKGGRRWWLADDGWRVVVASPPSHAHALLHSMHCCHTCPRHLSGGGQGRQPGRRGGEGGRGQERQGHRALELRHGCAAAAAAALPVHRSLFPPLSGITPVTSNMQQRCPTSRGGLARQNSNSKQSANI